MIKDLFRKNPDGAGTEGPRDPFEEPRNQMVGRQLVMRGIQDPRVLGAMRKVPRHRFVSDYHKGDAYYDGPLPIGSGQTISQPLMVAIMTEALRLQGFERVLEIGTGSGYQAAVLAELCAQVVSVERIEELHLHASALLREIGYGNVHCVLGDGTLGWPPEAPYDGIIVTAGGPEVPPTLAGQLKEGGRLVIPVGTRHDQTLVIATRREGKLDQERSTPCAFVPLIGSEGWVP